MFLAYFWDNQNTITVSASLVRVDILLSSQGVVFGAKMEGGETDDELELRQMFRPTDLSSGE